MGKALVALIVISVVKTLVVGAVLTIARTTN